MGYLTNTSLANKDRCEYAASASGMAVEFRDHPMPRDYCDPDDEYYHPEGLECGSVFTHEGLIDHRRFWRAWDAYK